MVYNNFLKVQNNSNANTINQSFENNSKNNEKKQFMVMDKKGALVQQPPQEELDINYQE
jgi:hypothetical protein